VPLRVVTWNLFHGRARPGAGCDLFEEFAAVIGSWEWDVALLQEVPPWWPQRLAARSGAHAWSVLTSRNGLLPLRRAVAMRRPDLIKSNGGGANAILVRGEAPRAHRTHRLCLLPERRWLHAVRTRDGIWIGNIHCSTDPPVAEHEADGAATMIRRWSSPGPVVLGGDFNVRELSLPGFELAASHHVDHIFVTGMPLAGAAELLQHGRLSDHAPLAVTIGV
jgi:endonuclease/exonuclease/phosphatase family metal-dependent hydrolase